LWDAKPLKIKGINKELAIRCDIGQQGKYGSIGIRTTRVRHNQAARVCKDWKDFYAVVEKQFCGA
jgi:hypothetical protein